MVRAGGGTARPAAVRGMARHSPVPVVFVLSALACVADVPRPGLLVEGRPVLVALVWAALAAAVGLYVSTRILVADPDDVVTGTGIDRDGAGDAPYVGGARASTA